MKFHLDQRVMVLASFPAARRRLGTVRQIRSDGSAFIEMDKPLPTPNPLFPRVPARDRWVLVQPDGAVAVQVKHK